MIKVDNFESSDYMFTTQTDYQKTNMPVGINLAAAAKNKMRQVIPRPHPNKMGNNVLMTPSTRGSDSSFRNVVRDLKLGICHW
jgi:hypothetical protein